VAIANRRVQPGRWGKPDTNTNGDSNCYANSYRHGYGNGYSYSDRDTNSYRNAYGNSRAKDYTDAEASPYTAAATVATMTSILRSPGCARAVRTPGAYRFVNSSSGVV
jgi:hypothetical protein